MWMNTAPGHLQYFISMQTTLCFSSLNRSFLILAAANTCNKYLVESWVFFFPVTETISYLKQRETNPKKGRAILPNNLDSKKKNIFNFIENFISDTAFKFFIHKIWYFTFLGLFCFPVVSSEKRVVMPPQSRDVASLSFQLGYISSNHSAHQDYTFRLTTDKHGRMITTYPLMECPLFTSLRYKWSMLFPESCKKIS